MSGAGVPCFGPIAGVFRNYAPAPGMGPASAQLSTDKSAESDAWRSCDAALHRFLMGWDWRNGVCLKWKNNRALHGPRRGEEKKLFLSIRYCLSLSRSSWQRSSVRVGRSALIQQCPCIQEKRKGYDRRVKRYLKGLLPLPGESLRFRSSVASC